MQKINSEEFDELLKSGKYDEATSWLASKLSEGLTKEQEGKILAENAMDYMDVVNEINDRYIALMDEIIESSKVLDQTELDLKNKLDIKKVKDSIKEL